MELTRKPFFLIEARTYIMTISLAEFSAQLLVLPYTNIYIHVDKGVVNRIEVCNSVAAFGHIGGLRLVL